MYNQVEIVIVLWMLLCLVRYDAIVSFWCLLLISRVEGKFSETPMGDGGPGGSLAE